MVTNLQILHSDPFVCVCNLPVRLSVELASVSYSCQKIKLRLSPDKICRSNRQRIRYLKYIFFEARRNALTRQYLSLNWKKSTSLDMTDFPFVYYYTIKIRCSEFINTCLFLFVGKWQLLLFQELQYPPWWIEKWSCTLGCIILVSCCGKFMSHK